MKACKLPLLLVGLALSFTSCTTPEDTKTVESEAEASTILKVNYLRHTVLETDIMDEPWGTHIDRVVVLEETKVTEERLRALLTHLYDNAKSTDGYQYNEHPTTARIWVYLTRDKVDSGIGQWVGMISDIFAEETPEGSSERAPQITISEKQLKLTTIVSQDKFGFTEEERQKIYKELTGIELATIDNPEMKPEYVNELAQELKTTVAVMDSIEMEGYLKGWTVQGL